MRSLPSIDERDVWERLSALEKPIVMYGMGNGADKALSKFEEYGIECADVFASEGFVRGQSFHGKTVISFNDVKEKYKDFAIVVSFASNRREVIDIIEELSAQYDVYIPDMAVVGEQYFTSSFYREHYREISDTLSMLADDTSRQVLIGTVWFKLTGKYEYLSKIHTDREEALALMGADTFSVYIDAGAYNGDTVRALLDFGAPLKRVLAIEPDAKTFKRLMKYTAQETRVYVESMNVAVLDTDTECAFLSSGNRNSSMTNPSYQKAEVTVSARSLDTLIVNWDNVDYIKYDVEGAECLALDGSRYSILKHIPALLISAYHRSEDIFALPRQLLDISADYNIYMRKYECFPAWEINLLAIPK